MSKQIKADLALLAVTIGWGASFLLTKNALNDLATYNFLAIRFLLAFFISGAIFYKQMLAIDSKTLKLGLGLGLLLFVHYALQTVGLNITTVSKSAFITGINVVLVPVFSALLIKKMPARSSVLGVIFAILGLGLLTLNGGAFNVNFGDLLTLLCAIVFALYIIAVGKYTTEVDSIPFAIIQLGVVGILSLVTTFAIETPVIPPAGSVWFNIIFLSVFCTSGAYIVQNIAQQYTSATHTALIYSGEPVFAAIFAFVLAGEVLSHRGILGACLILLGMLVAEIDLEKWFRLKEKGVAS